LTVIRGNAILRLLHHMRRASTTGTFGGLFLLRLVFSCFSLRLAEVLVEVLQPVIDEPSESSAVLLPQRKNRLPAGCLQSYADGVIGRCPGDRLSLRPLLRALRFGQLLRQKQDAFVAGC